jgi:2-polyprenyl-3-methyl-5-hydroxy-6-metoxy-1,4-benzoquinol methylase
LNSHQNLNLCPICSWSFKDSQSRTISYPTTAQQFENKPRFIVFCGNCSVGIAVPVWGIGEVEKFYSEGDYWGDSKTEILSLKKYPVPYALAVSRWKIIEPLLEEAAEPISILDIGAGHGFLGLVAAKSRNLHLSTYVYVEKDKTLAESLRKTWSAFPLKTNLQIEDNIDQVDGRFDCVVLSHILEHLTDPKTLLRSVVAKIKKGAVLFVDVPNQDYLFKKDVFPHFLFFDISSLQYLLRECGLSITSINCYGNNMNHSPMNFKNSSKIRSLFLEIIMRTRQFIPERVILLFFTRYFEMNRINRNGIWIRAIGRYPLT